ncbi:MAG TPA: YceI family protein, partial [Geminicoccaceae bacterium]|nr:YceI family protein [Geminicoccaceae bacterium]
DPADLANSRVEVEIDAASITTGHKDRDTTLRSSGFFDVAKWPTAHFTSAELTHESGDRYEAHGRLTIRDVTRDVVLPFELTIEEDGGRQLAKANGELTISRLDYGVGQGDWASTKTVGEEVVIRIEIRATRPG